MASSRRTGTNPSRWTGAAWEAGVNTYDSGGGKDYTNLATWEGDTDVDIVTATVSPVLEIYGTSHSLTGNATLASTAGYTSATYFRTIRPASGNFLTSGAISSYHFNATYASGSTFTIQEPYFQFQDIVATGTINSATSRSLFYISGNQAACVGCVTIDLVNSDATGVMNGFYLYASGSGVKVFAINCIAHNCDGDGFILDTASSGYPIVYNCTSTGNAGYGFNGDSTTYDILKNCGATGNGTADIEDSQFSETTDSESAPTFAAGTDNFHLAAADSTWQGQGTDLSGDANYAFDDDIDFETRSGTWDIGADEYVSAGATTLTAEQGSVAITGQATLLKWHHRIAAAQGSVAISGQAATLKWNRVVKAAQGAVAINGQAAVTKWNHVLKAAQGSVAITAQAATLKWHHVLKAAQGSVAISGQDATLTKSGAKTLTAEQGAVAITGQGALLKWHHVLKADQGSVAISGQDATLTKVGAGVTTLTAEQGAVAISGQAATLKWNRRLAAGQGAVAITGQAVTLKWHHLIRAQQAAVSIAGQAAQLEWNHILRADQGAVSVSGQAAVLKWNHLLTGLQGALAITGQDAALRWNRVLRAAQGSIAISGQDATLTYSGAPVWVAPAWRTATVEAESRMMIIENENRAMVIPAEDRRYVI